MFTIDGIVSGFDTSGIIDSLLGFQQTQIDTFNSRKADVATQQSSFKGIEAQLLTMQTSLGKLNRTVNSVFDARSATSSDDEAVIATASSGAIVSSYQLTVNQLATAQQIGSQGFETTNDQIAQGEYTFQVGDGPSQTISIDAGNNTVRGFVNAINEQVDDVGASIVFDQGTGSNRILLASRKTGASNTINVTNSTTPPGILPDFSGPAVLDARNAIVTLGAGTGAIVAEYESNTIDGLIEDVTLELTSADPNKSITVGVENDTESAIDAVNDFVETYNALIEFIDEQTRFDPTTESASPLLGDRSVSTIKNQLLTLVSETVGGSELGRLSQIGIDLDTKGRLSVDSNVLTSAIEGDLEGVDPRQIRNLFGLNASSDNSGITFLGGGPRTLASETPYDVNITQAAEQAIVTATTSLGGLLSSDMVIDSSNNEFQISVDGIQSGTLTLAEGTYTPQELAAELESVINQSSELGVHRVGVSVDADNKLVIQSEAYGNAARVAGIAGTAAADLGFDGTESDSGQDVAGVFIVDGVEEIANGSGRVLIGNPENENTGDLRLRVTLTSEQITGGVDASINVTRGITGRLEEYVGKITDTETGLLKTVNDAFESRIDSIDQSIEQVQELTESKREYLIAEFTALESIINELQTTGSFLSSQLSSIGSFGGSDNN